MSEHPIAKSLITKLGPTTSKNDSEKYNAQNFEVVDGAGLMATISDN